MTQHPPHPQDPCIIRGCDDPETCDEVCKNRKEIRPYRCCESCRNIPCKPLDRVPCASHTTPASHQRIERAIKELEKVHGQWGLADEHIEQAIALMREGEHNG